MEVKEDNAKEKKNLKTEKQSKSRKQDVKKKENTNELKKDETNNAKEDVPKQEISAERLAQLKDPRRVQVVMEHRAAMKMFESFESAKFVSNISIQPSMEAHRATQQFAEMKPITIREINPYFDHIYKGFKLKGTIVDEPVLSFSCIGMIVEDENGDIQRTAIYDIEQKNKVYTKFGYNCKITILDPYFRIAVDGKSVIRVDDISNVIFGASPDLSRCRYCGKNGLFMKCGNCNKATYCTKNCQKEDWKLGHKSICPNLL